MTPTPTKITNTYPTRGPLQQFRLAQAAPFACFRCGKEKKAKLQTVYNNDWSHRLCNSCYGELLSIYEVAAGTTGDADAADALAALLPSLVSAEAARKALRRRRYATNPEDHLSEPAIRFLATADFIAEQLTGTETFEWSPAVIGLCKALEAEVFQRLLLPLRHRLDGIDLSQDIEDKDVGRVARWCAGETDRPPELGAISHLLGTAAHSRRRAATSPTLRTLSTQLADKPRAAWITGELGVVLHDLTTRFRNPAAHLEVLSEDDYRACHEVIAGETGLLWRLADTGL